MAEMFIKDVRSCTDLGGLLNATMQIKAFNSFSKIAEELYYDLMFAISDTGFLLTSCTPAGMYAEETVEVFNSSDKTKAHEEFHKEVADNGLDSLSGLQSIFLEESMAHAVGDIVGNQRIIQQRSEAAEQLFPFYIHAVQLSSNGGFKQTDVEKMENIVTSCSLKSDYKNWATFVHLTETLGAYNMCVDLIDKYGVERAKGFVFGAMRRIKTEQDLNVGYSYLKKVLEGNGKEYPVWHETSVPNLRTPNSCEIHINDKKKDFNFGLWTYEPGIVKCVTSVLMGYSERLMVIEKNAKKQNPRLDN